MVCFGKVIGGGLPVGAFAARREIMAHLAPEGPVYQAGTLSGNPLAMSAGFTLLSELHAHPEVYTGLAERGASLARGIRDVMTEKSIPHQVNQVGSMLSLHLCDAPVVDFETAKAGDHAHFKALFHHMLDAGIYLPPSAYESWFLCSLIDDVAHDQTLSALRSFSPG